MGSDTRGNKKRSAYAESYSSYKFDVPSGGERDATRSASILESA